MIFKNLTKLDEDKVHDRIPSCSKKIEIKKPTEVKKDADRLFKNLAETEINEDLISKCNNRGEDDFLGVSKYSNPSCFLPNKNTETQRFTDSLLEEFLNTFNSKNSLEDQRYLLKPDRDQNECKCLQDFNYHRSNCF